MTDPAFFAVIVCSSIVVVSFLGLELFTRPRDAYDRERIMKDLYKRIYPSGIKSKDKEI